MLWAILGSACVIYTVVELFQLWKGPALPPPPTAGTPRTEPPPTGGAAPAPEMQFGDVEPPEPPVTLDRRTRHDPYLAQLKRRASDR